MLCPQCHAENRSGASFCKGCGQPLAGGEKCPHCGVPQAPGAHFCRSCGKPLAVTAPADTIQCPNCGASDPAGAVFCRRCGKALGGPEPAPAESPASVSADHIPCPHCGASDPPGAVFCWRCGKALGAAAPAPAETPAPVPAPAEVPPAQEPAPDDAEGEPMVSSDFVRQALAAPAGLKGALQDPSRLLQPAAVKGLSRARLNALEVLALLAVVALVAGFYLFGLFKFGLQAMLWSGTPIFLAYVGGLLIGLVSLRSVLDRFLRPVYGWLSRIPYRWRAVAGVVVPIAWCFLDSADRGGGFQHAGITVTVATLMGHVLLRSGEGEA